MTYDDPKEGHCEDALLKRAEADLSEAKAEVAKAEHDLAAAEQKIEKAEEEIEQAEHHEHDHGGHPHEVEIKVDGKVKHVQSGTYGVAAFKALVGVAADRELDIIKDGILHPLDDNGTVTICEHEVFVSHVRSGGSS